MARRIDDVDWASTPLQSPSAWPVSLKTYVRTLLCSSKPMLLWWGDDLIQFYNDAYRPRVEIAGLHPSALGQAAAVCWASIWPVLQPRIDRAMASSSTAPVETSLDPVSIGWPRDDDAWMCRLTPAFNDEGQIAGVLVLCEHRAEHALVLQRIQARERMLAVVGRTARVAGWRVDRDGTLRLTDEALELHGVARPDQATPEHMFALYTPESQPRLQEAFDACMAHGEPFDLELDVFDPAGDRRWVRVVGEPVHDGAGQVMAVQGAVQDIDQLKSTALQAGESERQFLELAESLPVIVWTADATGAVDYQSRA